MSTDHLQVATEAATVAGSMLAAAFGRGTVDSRSERDVKLSEDRHAENLIVDTLRRHSGWSILTEESGWIGEPAHDDAFYWVVDPLDGSFNFLAGVPLCCVSIAVCRGMRPMAGCVHDFLRRETFCAGQGQALLLNGQPLVLGPSDRRMLATGFPVGGRHNAAELAQDMQNWQKVRMLGSAALSLAWVAAGRLDGYREHGIRWWDVAAGLALVEGADGWTQLGAYSDDTAASGYEAGPLGLLDVAASRRDLAGRHVPAPATDGGPRP